MATNLRERTIYIPQMSYVAAKLMSAAFESIGVKAYPDPDSDNRTLELARKFTSGDECYPELITLGNVLKVVQSENFQPEKTAFLLPTSGGPCRFGQYQQLLKKCLKDLGLNEVLILSPTSSDGYNGFGEQATELLRVGWWAIVSSDILRKLLLKTRPYEKNKGDTDRLFQESLDKLYQVIATPQITISQKMQRLIKTLTQIRNQFRDLPADYQKDKKPLIGLVGEIFCRLNDFSNNFLIEIIEAHGGETWMSDISEWVWYTNDEQKLRIIRKGKRFSKEMLIARLKFMVQKYDEARLWGPFKQDFQGYEEVKHIHDLMKNSEPYLPQNGALGEMVSSIGKAIYLHQKGADGVIDISPFSCMNGIVCEAVFPQVSLAYDHFPIRTFYFDGTQNTVRQDVEIFMELARNYQSRKKQQRRYPSYFK